MLNQGGLQRLLWGRALIAVDTPIPIMGASAYAENVEINGKRTLLCKWESRSLVHQI